MMLVAYLSKKLKLGSDFIVSRKTNPRLWLMPVILATQKGKIKRIMVQSQLGKIVLKTLS
jgi:hypothetical protein